MSLRTLTLLAAAATALAVAVAPAGAAPKRIKQLERTNLLGPAHPFRDTVLTRAPKLRRLFDSGGTYTTADGIPVRVVVSSSYTPDPARGQGVADFLDSLLHGQELAKLTAYVGTFGEVQSICGTAALACYVPSQSALFVPGEDPPDGTPVEQVLAHEYGHHVSANRSNAPWDAEAWGPKRWASYMGICPAQAAGQVFPGDEASHYTLNPGEAWAESFRVANAQRIGTWPDIGWPVVDRAFMPDATALDLVAQDVLKPWTGGVTHHVTASLKKKGVKRFKLKTPLDGSAAATLTAAHGATAEFFDAKGHPLSTAGAHPHLIVCGQTTVTLSVRAKGAGKFTLAYVSP